jgi:acyl-CoA synthetase (AMP-forming)/AMP-acid ligase II
LHARGGLQRFYLGGYWGNAQASTAALSPPGWLRTGDLGEIDTQGRLWLLGRRGEVVKSGGENVHSSEVERALLSHPAIAAAAVVGLPHPRWGEQVAALLLLRPGVRWLGHSAGGAESESPAKGCNFAAELSEQAVRAHVCRSHAAGGGGLAGYKAPRLVVAWRGAGLPLGATGKADRLRIKAALLAAAAAALPDNDGALLRSRL